jgi:hypothetical protein
MAAIRRPLIREEAGVRNDPPATGGAERLMVALAKRGLRPEDRRAAAALCLALDGRR